MSVPNGFIELTKYNDTRSMRIRPEHVAAYEYSISGGSTVYPTGGNASWNVTETPEQIDALIGAAQGVPDVDVCGYVSVGPDGINNWWPVGPRETLEMMYNNAKREACGTDVVHELLRGRKVIEAFVSSAAA